MAKLLMLPVREADAVDSEPLPDVEARRQALDVSRSWAVEAPAGSGKTGLLIQRILRLLGSGDVALPEEVLAITFTRAATAEIRERVLWQLREAEIGNPPQDSFARETRPMADAVLQRDRERGWRLMEQPNRLRVRTIDALCGEIARSLPVLSGSAGTIRPIEDATALYTEAARRTWLRLGTRGDAEETLLDGALEQVLLYQDGDLSRCTELLAEMLQTRDQWGELVPLDAEALTEEVLEGEVRPRLNTALERVVCSGLTEVDRAMPPGALAELTAMAAELGHRPAYRRQVSPLALCRELRDAPTTGAEDLAHWRALAHLLVTPSTSNWRAAIVRTSLGFDFEEEDRERLKQIVTGHRGNGRLLRALVRLGSLPPATYPEEQWRIAKALFRVLGRATAELQVVFRERGECDFVEPGLLAKRALDRVEKQGDDRGVTLATVLGVDLKHLLVDEMQDTSTRQYELLERLTAGWAGTAKTVFLVGDPKQSIYLFRQARVERFLRVMRTGRMGDVEVGPLHLSANFRSRARLVGAFNEDFNAVFSPAAGNGAKAADEEIVYSQAAAQRTNEGSEANGVVWQLARTDAGPLAEQRKAAATQNQRNAKTIRQVVEDWRGRPLPAGRSRPWRVAVLVQNRRNLQRVLQELERDERVPYKAVNIDPLLERREVLDLLALTRALLHPADRIAWLAVLHAPWCGLDLRALHQLTGSDDARFAGWTVLDLLKEHGAELDTESIARLERVWPVFAKAVTMGGDVRLPELVERTWRSLGGDVYLEGAARENANSFLRLLRTVDRERGLVEMAEVNRRLHRLYAAPESGVSDLELLTIHGAKGLEWDVVLVPEMERRAPQPKQRLLNWEELDGGGVVLAPIKGKGEDSAGLARWLREISTERERAERKRLFYVACTRAKEELHLFGLTMTKSKGGVTVGPRSLLEAAWPAAERHLAEHGDVVVLPDSEAAGMLAQMAAAADPGEAVAERPARLERLPLSFRRYAEDLGRSPSPRPNGRAANSAVEFARPHGSLAARALGNAVHALLEEATRRLAEGTSAETLLGEISTWSHRIRGLLRTEGLSTEATQELAGVVRSAIEGTLRDATGRWLLERRPSARSEFALVARGDETRQYRMDRVFRAGATPGADGGGFPWIVDYKTATHGADGLEAFLEAERAKYTGQMEAYARALGEPETRLGLWFPLHRRLVWWVAGEPPGAKL